VENNQKLSYTVEDAALATSLTRSRLYQAIASGDLKSVKAGRQRLVTRKALQDYLAKLERDSAGRAA
jgi:excisionase family DNA binding protein